MLAFLIVSSIVVTVLSWIILACGVETEGVETFLVGLVVGVKWFIFLGIIFVIVAVIS